MKTNIFLVGFQKCGTTALHTFLTDHPKILGGKIKEPDFFSYEGIFPKGLDHYKSLYHTPYFGTLRGYHLLDSSPSYAYDENVLQTAIRIKQYNANARILFIVRNPIDRAYSAYNMYKNNFSKNQNWWIEWIEKRRGSNPHLKKRTDEDYKSFESYVLNEIRSIRNGEDIEAKILDVGLYVNGIKPYLKVFSNESVLVVQNERLLLDTTKTLQKTSAFLGVPSHNWTKFENKKVFKASYQKTMSDELKEILNNYYSEANAELMEITGINYK